MTTTEEKTAARDFYLTNKQDELATLLEGDEPTDVALLCGATAAAAIMLMPKHLQKTAVLNLTKFMLEILDGKRQF